MNISSEERKKLNESLTALMEASQRSLVSLRKNDLEALSLDVDQLGVSITAFILQTGGDLLPTSAV